MATRKQTYTVVHSSLYFRIAGKMQELEAGSQIELEPARAKKMLAKGWVVDPTATKTVALDGSAEASE